MSRAGPGQSQELHLESHVHVRGPRYLGQRTELEVEQSGYEPAPIWKLLSQAVAFTS